MLQATASLQHPHILPLFDPGAMAGILDCVMPFVDGETPREKLNRETQLGVDVAVRIARDVEDADRDCAMMGRRLLRGLGTAISLISRRLYRMLRG